MSENKILSEKAVDYIILYLAKQPFSYIVGEFLDLDCPQEVLGEIMFKISEKE